MKRTARMWNEGRRNRRRNSIIGLLLPVLALTAGLAHATSENFFTYTYLSSLGENSQPNGISATQSITANNATNSASASLANGKMGVLNAGSATTGIVYSQAIAQMGDSISVAAPASGLSGLNLGLTLTVDGSSSSDSQVDLFTYLGVYIYKMGTFDTTTFWNKPENILYAAGYTLGNVADPYNLAQIMSVNDLPLTASLGDSATIPLEIPFSNLGTDFQVMLILNSSTLTMDGGSWSADFSHTLGLTFTAPDGVTVFAASDNEGGNLPGTVSGWTAPNAPVPEPGTIVLLGSGILCLGGLTRRKTKK